MVTYEFLSSGGPCESCIFCEWCGPSYPDQSHKPGTCYHLRQSTKAGFSDIVVCADCLREKGLIW